MTVKSEQDLAGLVRVGKVVALALREMEQRSRIGMTTADLDEIGAEVLARHGARSAPQLVYGFPGATCISVNDEVVHGIPGTRVIQAGDLVKLDVTAELGGYVADAAVTVALPSASPTAQRLRDAAASALDLALLAARPGKPIRRIGRAIATEVGRRGFRVIPELAGHGVGRTIHEPPSVPQFDDPRARRALTEGLVITIEPIIAAGGDQVALDPDGWTVRTVDGGLSAHHEHTVVITRGRPLVLTTA